MLRDDVVLPVRRQIASTPNLGGATCCPRRIADPAISVCRGHATAASNVSAELPEPGTRRGDALAGIHQPPPTKFPQRRAGKEEKPPPPPPPQPPPPPRKPPSPPPPAM